MDYFVPIQTVVLQCRSMLSNVALVGMIAVVKIPLLVDYFALFASVFLLLEHLLCVALL